MDADIKGKFVAFLNHFQFYKKDQVESEIRGDGAVNSRN